MDINIDGLYYHGTIAGAPTEIYIMADEENTKDIVLSINLGEKTIL